MKKSITFLILSIVFLPCVTYASWWNPFSWNFNKTTPVVQVGKNDTNKQKESLLLDTKTEEIKISKKDTTPVKKVDRENSPKGSYNTVKTVFPENKKTEDAPNKVAQNILDYRKILIGLYEEHISELEKTKKVDELMQDATKYKIKAIENDFIHSEGMKLANPAGSPGIDYVDSLFKPQLSFEKDFLSFYDKVIPYLQSSIDTQEENLSRLKTASTDEEMKSYSSALNNSQVELKKIKDTQNKWMDTSEKIQIKLDGILDGLNSRYSNTNTLNNQPILTIPSTPSYIPTTSPYKVTCTTHTTFTGDLETKCY